MSEKSRGEQKGKSGMRLTAISLLIGNIIGTVLFFLLTLLASAVILKKTVSSDFYTPVAVIISGLSALAAGFAAVRPIRKNGLIMGLGSSILLIACICASAALTSGGSMGIKTAIAAAVAAVCAAVGGILAANMKKRSK